MRQNLANCVYFSFPASAESKRRFLVALFYALYIVLADTWRALSFLNRLFNHAVISALCWVKSGSLRLRLHKRFLGVVSRWRNQLGGLFSAQEWGSLLIVLAYSVILRGLGPLLCVKVWNIVEFRPILSTPFCVIDEGNAVAFEIETWLVLFVNRVIVDVFVFVRCWVLVPLLEARNLICLSTSRRLVQVWLFLFVY